MDHDDRRNPKSEKLKMASLMNSMCNHGINKIEIKDTTRKGKIRQDKIR
jgi:hypothetical protein